MTANLPNCPKCNFSEFSTRLGTDYLSADDREITVIVYLKCNKCDNIFNAYFGLTNVEDKMYEYGDDQ